MLSGENLVLLMCV